MTLSNEPVLRVPDVDTAVAVPASPASPATPTTHELPLCQVCSANPPKYRCPGCATRTCSLACVRSHKAATQCSGQRNKTQYVPLERYNENTLFSDYALLEDTARTTDNAARNRHSGPLYKVAKPTQFKLPVKLHKLQLAAGKRGTRVRFMSRGMKRAEDNASYVDFTTEVVHWSVEVQLPSDAATEGSVLLTPPVPESDSVESVVTAFGDPASAASLAYPAAHVAMSALLSADPRPQLHYYWRRPNPIRGQPGRLLVPIADPSTAIKDALNGVPVLEFPVLVVARAPLPESQVVLPTGRSNGNEEEDVPVEPLVANSDALIPSDDDDSPPEESPSCAPSSFPPSPPQPKRPPHLPVPPTAQVAPPARAPPARAHASLPAKPATLPPLPSSTPSSAVSSPTASPRAPAPPASVNAAPWRTPTWSANPYSAEPPAAHPPPSAHAGWSAARPALASSHSRSAPHAHARPAAPASSVHPWAAAPTPAAAAPQAPLSLAGWGAAQVQQPQARQQPATVPPPAGTLPSSEQVLALWQQLAAGQQDQVQRALAADFGGPRN